jgi:hypothetical protein
MDYTFKNKDIAYDISILHDVKKSLTSHPSISSFIKDVAFDLHENDLSSLDVLVYTSTSNSSKIKSLSSYFDSMKQSYKSEGLIVNYRQFPFKE